MYEQPLSSATQDPTAPPADDALRLVSAVHRDMLAFALRSAAKTIPMLLMAGWFVAWVGLRAGATTAAIAVALMTTVTASWRYVLVRRYRDAELSPATTCNVEVQMRANAFLAGLTWALSTIAFYPLLGTRDSAMQLAIIIGSAALSVQTMTLIRWSFPLLVVPTIGSLAYVSLFVESTRSIPLALLAVIYVATLLKTGAQYRETTERAIEHGLAVDEANLQLQKAKEDAEAGTVAKSQFLATMSHEIRTPMNGVLGSLELLRRSQLSEEQRRLVRTAAASGESLMAILNDVLDHSKIEAGKLSLKSDPLSVMNLATSVIGLFRANAEDKGLALKLNLDPQVPDWVIGDGPRIKQVLLNLVSNAVKFTKRGSVKLNIRLIDEELVQFEVEDTGAGISPEAAAQLFTPFTQLQNDAPTSRRGTGLGLAISQRIVEAMGGHIEIDSTLGKGSTFRFTVTLPELVGEAPRQAPDTTTGTLDPAAPLAGVVLLVEDDAVNRLIARTHLEALGMEVIEATDGEQALEAAHGRNVDLVLMDCHMPKVDGYTATRLWRERESQLGLPRTPIIALTANAFDDDIRHTREAGMDAHLAKPYTRKQIKEKVEAWL
jgi:signal transduction histidine kinase/CheY-like chemotaxis protein